MALVYAVLNFKQTLCLISIPPATCRVRLNTGGSGGIGSTEIGDSSRAAADINYYGADGGKAGRFVVAGI